jgi:hypothetical protein
MLGACGGVSSHVDSKGTPPSSVLFVGSEDWTTFLSLVEWGKGVDVFSLVDAIVLFGASTSCEEFGAGCIEIDGNWMVEGLVESERRIC